MTKTTKKKHPSSLLKKSKDEGERLRFAVILNFLLLVFLFYEVWTLLSAQMVEENPVCSDHLSFVPLILSLIRKLSL